MLLENISEKEFLEKYSTNKIISEEYHTGEFELYCAGYILPDGSFVMLDPVKEEGNRLGQHGDEPQFCKHENVEFSNSHAEDDTCVRIYSVPTNAQYKSLEFVIDKYLDSEGYCKVELLSPLPHKYVIFSNDKLEYSSYGYDMSAVRWSDKIYEGPNWYGYTIVRWIKQNIHKKELEESYTEYSSMKDKIDAIADNIRREVDAHENDGPYGNQNCMLCTWAVELQLRGEDFLPRPVISEDDIIFEKGHYNFVKGGKKETFESVEDLQDILVDDARYYCHVNWADSEGGHEFLLVNTDGNIYIVDGQAGKVVELSKDNKYFNDINFSNSYVVRVDDKELNQEVLNLNDIDKMSKSALEESLENIVYKDISDLDHYKKSAKQILGSEGGLSDNGIMDTGKEIYIDDKLVGYISFEEYDNVEDYNKVLGIGNFMILERGQGYGTQVLKDLVNKYKSEYDLIYCFVDADNQGAIKLYKKLGKVYDEDGPNDNGQYYVTFYDKNEDRDDLVEAKKRRKKRKPSFGWFTSLNPDAGNVEYNNAFFNHVMGNTTTAEFGEAAANAECCGMSESIENKQEFIKMDKEYQNKVELFNKMCREQHFLQMCRRDEFEDVMNNFLQSHDIDALVNDIRYDGSTTLSSDEIEYIVKKYFVADEMNEDLSKKICSICGDEFEGWGNNAWPVNDGCCCDSCNYLFVLPERIRGLNNRKAVPDVAETIDELNKLDD